jgi:hypothetical protein
MKQGNTSGRVNLRPFLKQYVTLVIWHYFASYSSYLYTKKNSRNIIQPQLQIHDLGGKKLVYFGNGYIYKHETT